MDSSCALFFSLQPMFMYFAHLAVHTGNSWKPLEAQYKYYSRLHHIPNERRRTFAGQCGTYDEILGRDR